MFKIPDILAWTVLLGPLCAILSNVLFGKANQHKAARIATNFIGLGFIAAISQFLAPSSVVINGLAFSSLGLILAAMILFISFIVHRFSERYLRGDRLYRRYFSMLSSITLSTVICVLADNLLLFWLGWTASNLLLITLMIHKNDWKAAHNSGILTLKALLSGSILLLAAITTLFSYSGTWSLAAINSTGLGATLPITIAMGLIIVAAMLQSAQWPFQSWLLSSLNSPTPVSALMHAGLVNGGGLLIVKFAPLMIQQPSLLGALFCFGAITAFFGTASKLVQWNIKGMLASSTVAQMGFMMMQCGLGLFPAAISHLCWHGMFKAYLFLSSGSAVEQKPKQMAKKPFATNSIISALIGGSIGMLGFALISGTPIFSLDTSSFLLVFAFVTGSQITLSLTTTRTGLLNFILSLVVVFALGATYGASMHLIESLLPSIAQLPHYQLNNLHFLTMLLFFGAWLCIGLGFMQKIGNGKLWDWFYVQMLNLSAPNQKTVTANRTSYNY